MKVYAISGLGADKSVFQFLKLKFELIHIEWLDNLPNETIENYSKRLSEIIDKDSEFTIIGLSFGGLIAVEISKILKPKKTILISSAKTKFEIPLIYRIIGKTRILNFLPVFFLKKSNIFIEYLFGTKKKQILASAIEKGNTKFSKWAVIQLVNWQNTTSINCIKISGEKDLLIPAIKNDDFIIKNAKHLMIVDKANELSTILNDIVDY